jgi:hypothetical protein|tara:strand:+ start:2422 stop:2769 length:348 start_codon:yes stop_codon:yes gene_type:complete
MKILIVEPIKGYKGENIQIPYQEGGKVKWKEANVKDILWTILHQAPFSSQNDSIEGRKLAVALDNANGVIKIEDSTFLWIKPIAEKVTPQLFKINGNVVYEYICNAKEPDREGKE